MAFTAPVVTFFSLDAYDFGCTLGVACAVSLDGFPGNATTHAVLLGSGDCGDEAPVLAQLDGITNPVAATVVQTSVYYEFGLATAGAPHSQYKLCFGVHPEGLGQSRRNAWC